MNADDHGRWQPVDNIEIFFEQPEVIMFVDGPKDGEYLHVKSIKKEAALPAVNGSEQFTYINIHDNVYIPAGNADRVLYLMGGLGSGFGGLLGDGPMWPELEVLMAQKLCDVLQGKGWGDKRTKVIGESIVPDTTSFRTLCKRVYYVYE